LKLIFSFRASYLIRLLLVFVGALPWALAAFGSSAHSLHFIFKDFCHQMPERTLTICGAPMAICSRCAGIYAGIAIGALLPPMAFMGRHGRVAIWIAFSIVMLDVAIQNYMLHSINHFFRITTGFVAGWAASAFLFSSIDDAKLQPKGRNLA
jgi:uncharacterized membrane protein